MQRNVEMYQYRQHSHQEGSENDRRTVYTYSLEWASTSIPSDSFHNADYRGKNDHKWMIDRKLHQNSDIRMYDIKL